MLIEKGFELSEVSNTPVMLEVRVRACHMHGSFACKDNVKPAHHHQGRAQQPQARRQPHRAAAGGL